MEHVVRIELTSSDWKSDIITIILYMHILAGAKGIEPLSVVLETTIIAVILYSYIWRRGWDLNPRYLRTLVFKTRTINRTRTPLQKKW